MKPKFSITFKKDSRETGLCTIGHPNPNINIKLNKCKCGIIYTPNWQRRNYEVAIQVKNPKYNPPDEQCEWTWLFIKEKFQDEESARKWCKDNLKQIDEKYTIYLDKDDE